ncbi:MAG: hypothetical protein ACRDFA_04850 [bacterium]
MSRSPVGTVDPQALHATYNASGSMVERVAGTSELPATSDRERFSISTGGNRSAGAKPKRRP